MTAPFRIAVLGGGTAGWLSALILREAGKRSNLDLEISVVESTRIPTIGVGEGTTSVFRGMLLELGFDEFEFIRETGATIKYGIRHRDWRRLDHHYDGPIDDPHAIINRAGASFLNQYLIGAGRPVTEPHLFSYLMDRGRAPFLMRDGRPPLPVAPFHHAYHFDQALVGQYLRAKSKGITHIDALISGVEKDGETGDVRHLVGDDGRLIAADFFVDCSGFRRALISAEMGAGWIEYGDRLPVNRAMPFWLDHDPGTEIPAFTHAHAKGAGWMWQIPTQDRLGCGYVYSDAFLSPEEAQAEIETALGHPIEPRNDIRISSGRLSEAWIGNCLAAGLAQSFFEPLEATSIHGTIVQMMLFSQAYLPDLVRGKRKPDGYNDAVVRQVDDFCTFINLHYVSERRDTPFWRTVAEDCIGPEVRELLRLWQTKTPSRADFAPFPGGLPHIEDQLYVPVLDGLGLTSREAARAEMSEQPKLRTEARKTVDKLRREFRRAAGKAPSHRSFLEYLRDRPAA